MVGEFFLPKNTNTEIVCPVPFPTDLVVIFERPFVSSSTSKFLVDLLEASGASPLETRSGPAEFLVSYGIESYN